jgi:endonuclease III
MLPAAAAVPLAPTGTFLHLPEILPEILTEVCELPGGSVPLARATLGPLPVAAVVAVAYAADAADGAAAAAAPSGAKVAGAELGDSAAAVAAAVAASEATRARYEACAAAFEPLTAENVERKMQSFNTALEAVYGELPFTRLDWSTSVLGTLVGLICAQTCRNSWSSIGYANLAATFPSAELPNEPDWDLIRQRRPEDIEPCIWHGPYFHMKAERIHALLGRVFEDSGGVATSLERLHQWPSDQIRRYLLSYNGLSGKSIACLLLYRMGRVDFAVDANVLRVMTRLGWLKRIGIYATEGLSSVDRRSAQRAGAILPVGLNDRHLARWLPPPQPKRRLGVGEASGASRALKVPRLAANAPPASPTVWVTLRLGIRGSSLAGGNVSVSASLACRGALVLAPLDGTPASKGKGPKTAHDIYVEAMRPALSLERPKCSRSELRTLLLLQWKQMDAAERAPWLATVPVKDKDANDAAAAAKAASKKARMLETAQVVGEADADVETVDETVDETVEAAEAVGGVNDGESEVAAELMDLNAEDEGADMMAQAAATEDEEADDLRGKPHGQHPRDAEAGRQPPADQIGADARRLIQQEQEGEREGRIAEAEEMQQHQHPQRAIGQREAPIGERHDDVVPRSLRCGGAAHELRSPPPPCGRPGPPCGRHSPSHCRTRHRPSAACHP